MAEQGDILQCCERDDRFRQTGWPESGPNFSFVNFADTLVVSEDWHGKEDRLFIKVSSLLFTFRYLREQFEWCFRKRRNDKFRLFPLWSAITRPQKSPPSSSRCWRTTEQSLTFSPPKSNSKFAEFSLPGSNRFRAVEDDLDVHMNHSSSDKCSFTLCHVDYNF